MGMGDYLLEQRMGHGKVKSVYHDDNGQTVSDIGSDNFISQIILPQKTYQRNTDKKLIFPLKHIHDEGYFSKLELTYK
jgi:hypothetical protein